MNSIIYLILTSFKNNILELKKNPWKIIMYIVVIALIVFAAISSSFAKQTSKEYISMYYLKAIFFAYIMLFVVISLSKSLSSGDTFFEMNDVNLLFVSPISSKKILIYGLMRMTKIAFFAGFFILFQSGSLGTSFGINFGGLVVLLISFMINMILAEIICLVIYSYTNGNDNLKMLVRIVAAIIFSPAIIFFVFQFIRTGNFSETLNTVINSDFVNFLPIAGWGAEGVASILTGNTLRGVSFLAISLLVSVILVIILILSKSDYYEDVLVATETAFEKKLAVSEGNINGATTQSNRRIKVSGIGIKGWGASAIFSKHYREFIRGNRLKFISTSFLMYLIIGIGVSMLFRGEFNITLLLQILMWLQIYLVGMGRGLKETYTHYIYLIPKSSFSKIVWSNMESVLKTFIESCLLFGILGVILKDNILIIIGSIAVYSLFTLFLIGINYLSMRITQVNINEGLLILIYSFAVIVFMLPGLIPALIVGFLIGGIFGTFIGLLILSLWELIAALICFYFSKGVLHNSDMPVLRPTK